MANPDPVDVVLDDIDGRTPRGWYGMAVGEGWHEIIKDVHRQIVALFPDYEVYQIKEKFGGLRFYCSVEADPQVAAIIREAEDKADHTCEGCGTTENVTTGPSRPDGFWVKTLCTSCRGGVSDGN